MRKPVLDRLHERRTGVVSMACHAIGLGRRLVKGNPALAGIEPHTRGGALTDIRQLVTGDAAIGQLIRRDARRPQRGAVSLQPLARPARQSKKRSLARAQRRRQESTAADRQMSRRAGLIIF